MFVNSLFERLDTVTLFFSYHSVWESVPYPNRRMKEGSVQCWCFSMRHGHSMIRHGWAGTSCSAGCVWIWQQCLEISRTVTGVHSYLSSSSFSSFFLFYISSFPSLLPSPPSLFLLLLLLLLILLLLLSFLTPLFVIVFLNLLLKFVFSFWRFLSSSSSSYPLRFSLRSSSSLSSSILLCRLFSLMVASCIGYFINYPPTDLSPLNIPLIFGSNFFLPLTLASKEYHNSNSSYLSQFKFLPYLVFL